MRAFAILFACVLASTAAAETLVVGGVERTWKGQFPVTRPAPVVIVLHGRSQQGGAVRERTAWPDVARRGQFGVVFPDGLNRAWADMRAPNERASGGPPPGTDDTAFIVELAEKLILDGVADPKRIYVTGISNGGAMTLTLACQRPDLFAAAASVIMAMSETMANNCRPSRHIPMLIMNGTEDPLVAWNGGRGRNRVALLGLLSTPDTLKFWRRANGCDPGDARAIDLPDIDRTDRSTVTRIESRCPPGTAAVLYRVNGGGHRMPGYTQDTRAKRLVDRVLGPQNHDIDGAQTIWDFFKGFAKL